MVSFGNALSRIFVCPGALSGLCMVMMLLYQLKRILRQRLRARAEAAHV